MNAIRRFRTASLGVRLLVLVALSLFSVVVARALIGVEVRDNGVPVARGDVADGFVEVYVLPSFPDDAELRLTFDDDTREDGFARLRDGQLEITTIDGGTEPLADYLRRLGILGEQVGIESSCEIMAPGHPFFSALCMAYDRGRMPATHEDVGTLPCSTCHATADLEADYERARRLAPTSATLPAGHRDVGDTPCATCHAGFAGGGEPDATAALPPGHRNIGSQACSSCHGSSAGDPGADPIALPPGHRDIGSQACSSCHGSSAGDPGAPAIALPRGHRDIGSLACTTCHASGTGDDDGWDDDDEHDDDDEEDDEDDEEDDEHDEEDDEHDDEHDD